MCQNLIFLATLLSITWLFRAKMALKFEVFSIPEKFFIFVEIHQGLYKLIQKIATYIL